MKTDKIYKTSSSDSYFSGRYGLTKDSSAIILNEINKFFLINSVIDIGCGVGTWLEVAKNYGANEVLGLDGNWVDPRLLKIDKNEFLEVELNNRFPKLESKFDLAIWLENAEHLKPGVAEMIIEEITKITDIVLFSAAIPYQGGRGHLNEQWQSYWADIFYKNGFFPIDLIRPKIWENDQIPYWYRQNLVVFCSNKSVTHANLSENIVEKTTKLDVVHPELWQKEFDLKFKRFLKRAVNKFRFRT